MKRCSKCGETKPRSEFHKERAAKDGLKSQCKDCRAEYQRSPTGKASSTRYRQSLRGKAVRAKADKKYRRTDRGKQVFKEGQAKYHRGIKGFLHRLFNNIIQRCSNRRATGYKHWGGKGIQCLFKSFDEFFHYVTVDLGYDSVEKLKGLHIHRTDNNGHYEPDNIEFLTSKEHKARMEEAGLVKGVVYHFRYTPFRIAPVVYSFVNTGVSRATFSEPVPQTPLLTGALTGARLRKIPIISPKTPVKGARKAAYVTHKPNYIKDL